MQASFPELAGLVAAVEEWTVWAVAYRYPLEEGPDEVEPDDEELRRALATIETLAARLRAAKPQDRQLPSPK